MNHFLRPVTLKKVCNTLVLATALVFFHATAPGGTPEESDSLLTGFEETEVVLPVPPSSPKASFFDHFSGWAKLFTVAHTTHNTSGQGNRDWQGLSALRLEGQLEADFRFSDWKTFVSLKGFCDFSYAVNGRGEYTNDVLEEYEKEVELQEAYLQGSPANNIDLKLGRQIVVWGRSDNFRVTDVLNPLDNRDLGLVDIENIRLPLFMTKVDLFFGKWNLDLIAVHEHRYDKNPPLGHFFNPYSIPLPGEDMPSGTLENTEFGLGLNGTFNGWGVSFYGARYFNDQPTFTPTDPLTLVHEKVSMIGTSLSIARGNMLYIAELAHIRGHKFMNDYGRDYNRSDLLAGIEYSGWPDTLVSLDYVTRYLHHYDAILGSSPENPKRTDNQIACRISRHFYQDLLELEALLLLNGELGQRGAMQRFSVQYDITDNWRMKTGLQLYQARNGPLSSIGDINRVFFELRFDL